MLDVARDALHVPLAQGFFLAADIEDRPAFEDHADLLVRMAVLRDNGMRLQLDVGQHYFFHAAGHDVDPGEDDVMRTVLFRREIEAHFESPRSAKEKRTCLP